MAAGDLIDFDIIEGQKENIQSLPGGRSAKKLVEAFSPSPLHKLATPTPTDTKNINDCIRAEYEEEVANISESDDPLDVFDRYVRWTFDAYPSAQATPQSQLHTLLERATKTFIGSAQYKNDPRYLKLWLHYIRFFSDSPRETYVFLSRHSVGEGLALFYEEYAAWLESAGRWAQAEEVYKLGIEREARPVQRLVRKFGEFEQRRAQQPDSGDAPSSPALPTVRPALAAKMDPFVAASARAADPQAPRPNMGVGGPSSKPGKAKLAVFSDASSDASAMSSMGEGAKGWDTIGSLADRKKENVMEAKPWVGETLATQVKKSSGPKMAVFRDPSLSRIAESHIVIAPSKHQVVVNSQSGKRERIFVNLEAIYPTPEEPGTELSFEELWAANQGWLGVCWEDGSFIEEQQEPPSRGQLSEVDLLSQQVAEKLVVHQDIVELDENGAIKDQPKPGKSKKKKVIEVNETQIIQARLNSPSGPKLKKKSSATAKSEPTMTLHTKAATDDIYGIFNQPLESAREEADDSDSDYMTDGDYTSGGESVNMTEQNPTSEADGDDWTDFTVQKHLPKLDDVSDDDQVETTSLIDQSSPPKTRSNIVLLEPDVPVPTGPFRNAAEVANNRLPYMTPIAEKTESSVGCVTLSKRPNRDDVAEDEDMEPPSSPLQCVSGETRSPAPKKMKISSSPTMMEAAQQSPPIKAKLCDPHDEDIRDKIIELAPPEEGFFNTLSSLPWYYGYPSIDSDRAVKIQRHFRAHEKTAASKKIAPPPFEIEFADEYDVHRKYTVKWELGKGSNAPVYAFENSSPQLAENALVSRESLEAMKVHEDSDIWEYYMMCLVAERLGPQHRAMSSIVVVHEFHHYNDESFLIMPYYRHGTLLGLVNHLEKGKMDELLAMFFAIELLRTVEALHSKNIMHGDLKTDNVLLRLDNISTGELSHEWYPDGSGGWAGRGITLIDFGRAIDMSAFRPDVQFKTYKPSPKVHCCIEVQQQRPWTWQADYYGMASIIHELLFGKYMEVNYVGTDILGGGRYNIQERLKRYWQTDIWNECFDILLNPESHVEAEDGCSMPVTRSLQRVRERMEKWLEANCLRSPSDLRTLMRQVEAYAKRQHPKY